MVDNQSSFLWSPLIPDYFSHSHSQERWLIDPAKDHLSWSKGHGSFPQDAVELKMIMFLFFWVGWLVWDTRRSALKSPHKQPWSHHSFLRLDHMIYGAIHVARCYAVTPYAVSEIFRVKLWSAEQGVFSSTLRSKCCPLCRTLESIKILGRNVQFHRWIRPKISYKRDCTNYIIQYPNYIIVVIVWSSLYGKPSFQLIILCQNQSHPVELVNATWQS